MKNKPAHLNRNRTRRNGQRDGGHAERFPTAGPDPLDDDTLRDLTRKAEVLGLEETTASAGALSQLPEDDL